VNSYHYQATKPGGERAQGTIAARTKAEACQKLEQQKLQPISLQLGAESAVSAAKSADSVAPKPQISDEPVLLSNKQIVQFTDELSDLLEAGLQLEPALGVMEQRRELSRLKLLVHALRQRVRSGGSFSGSLAAVSPSFSNLYCKLMAAGEISGALPQILRRQARHLIEMGELQSRVIQALIYPAILCGTGALLLGVFMTVLVPQLTLLFSKTGQSLPLMTQLLIAVSSFLAQWWWALLLVLFAAGLTFMRVTQQPKGRAWWHQAQLRIPLVGEVIASRYYVQFTQTLATLVGNGIPLLNALNLMHAATGNVHLHRLLGRVVELVSEGGSFSKALHHVGQFPATLIDMIAIGEQTGDLGKALEKAGDRYDKELNKKIQRLTSFVQPVVILVMAGMVGVVAFSMITGIFQSVSGLRGR
jgi:type II secretory pathway component PulF